MRFPWSQLAAIALCALALAPAGESAAQCSGDPVLVRPLHDTRLMRAHPSANDGAAGLVWLKRSSHVRGLVGFDLSCQAAATENVDCAELEVSIYHGSKRDRSNFSAHRVLVPWVEGNQSFNEFKFGAEKLGSFGGTGPGTTWDCRVDPDVSNNHSDQCAEKWDGADDCGAGVPCYDPVASTAYYASEEQLELTWNVAPHVVGADALTSWLVKVEDETVKSSALKFYTREGAQFMADNDPLPGAAAHFDSAPRLLLWGDGFVAPTAALVSPLDDQAESPLDLRITQLSATKGESARWQNLATGEWGWMVDGGGMEWTASIPLVPGPNEIELTLWDACGTEGKAFVTKFHGSAQAFLCYSAKTTSRTPGFTPIRDLAFTDALETGLVDVAKLARLCMPANVDGVGIPDPALHGVAYKAKTARNQPAHEGTEGIVFRDRFGKNVIETLRVDGMFVPASLGFGVEPPPLPGSAGPYKCYRARSSGMATVAKRITVQAADALEDREYRVRHTTRVCYPAAGESAFPLLCYRVARAAAADRHRPVRNVLRSLDDFGSLAIDTRREVELCLAAEPE